MKPKTKYEKTQMHRRPIRLSGVILIVLSVLVTYSLGLRTLGLRTTAAYAADGINPRINFQGRLTTPSGAPVADATYNMEFRIYRDGDGNPGGGDETLLWTETRTAGSRVGVTNGHFSILLGEVSGFGSSVDWNHSTLWLSVQIGGSGGVPVWDGEMSPMKRLASVPQAFNADTVDGAHAGTGANQVLRLDGSGNINIGGSIQSTAGSLSVTGTATIGTLGAAGATSLCRNGSNQIASCSATVGTLQSAYDLGNTISTTDARNIAFTLADTTTDSNFVVNLACVTCSAGGGDFIIQDAGTAFATFADTGEITFQSSVNSPAAFTILNSTGSIAFRVGTSDSFVGIGRNPGAILDLIGGSGGSTLVRVTADAFPGNVEVFTIDAGGATTFRTHTNSTTGFRVQNAAGTTTVLDVDTTNARVGIGTNAPSEALQLHQGIMLTTSGGTPETLGSLDLGLDVRAVYVSGKYAYVGLASDGGAGNDFRIYDISNPSAAPVLIGGMDITGGVNAIYVSGKYAYLGNDDVAAGDFKIVDVSNPTSPTTVGDFHLGASGQQAQAVYVSGRYAFIGKSAAGITNSFIVLDTTNPASPTSVFGTSDSVPFSIYVSGKYAYVGRSTAGATCPTFGQGCEFQIWDASNPTSLTFVGGLDPGVDVRSVYVSGKYAYITMDNIAGTTCPSQCEFQIIDIGNPASPSVTGSLDLGGGSGRSVQVAGKYAYLTKTNAGSTNDFMIIDVSTPASPSAVGGNDIAADTPTAFVAGKFAAVGNVTIAGSTCPAQCEFRLLDLPGLDAPTVSFGSTSSNYLTVTDNARVENDLYVGNGVQVGVGGIQSTGSASFTTTDARDISITLQDTATDANFVINIIADNTVRISRVNNSSAEAPAQLLLLENLDTNLTIADGILFNVATGGVLTDAIDVSDADIVNAINIGDNVILGANTPAIDFANFDITTGGLVQAADGGPTQVAYGFQADGDTGMYHPANNQLAFSTNNTERIRIDSGGQVGIGTATPRAGLTLADGAHALFDAGFVITPFGGFGRYQNFMTRSEEFDTAAWTKSANTTVAANNATAPNGLSTADTITFAANAATDEIFQTTGQTAVSKTFTASVWLKFTSATTVRMGLRGTGATPERGDTVVSVTAVWQRFSFTRTFTAAATGNAEFFIDDNANAAAVSVQSWGGQVEEASNAGVYAMTTDTGITTTGRGLIAESAGPHLFMDGKVGIGTGTALSSKLTVDSTAADDGIILQAGGVRLAEILRDGVLNVGRFDLKANETVTVRMNAGGTVFFNTGGNVGIGTAGPGARLDVTNTGTAPFTQTGLRLQSTFSPSAGGTQVNEQIITTNAPTVAVNTTRGLEITVVDATALANTNIGLFVNPATANTADTQIAAILGGNVTVGALTNPADALDVTGSVRVSALGAAGATSICRNASNQISTCSAGASTATLQSAYDTGNTITTTDSRNIAFTLADTTTDSDFIITTATGSTGRTRLVLADGGGTTPPNELLLVETLDTDLTIANGIRFNVVTGGVVTDAIDVTDGEIVNALNVGNNTILGITPTIDFTNLDIAGDGSFTWAVASATSGIFNLSSTGDFIIQDAGTAFATFADDGTVLFKSSVNSTTAFQVQPSASSTPALNVDTTNSRVGIGTASPANALHIEGNGELGLLIDIASGSAGSNPIIFTKRARGSIGALTTVADGDQIFEVFAQGYNGTSYLLVGQMTIEVDGAPGAQIPGRIKFATTPASGGSTDRLIIFQDGKVTVGGTSSSARLHVSSLAAEPLFRVTDATVTAIDVLNIADEGATIFKNRTNSTTAFQVQPSASATPVLNVDTTNSRVGILSAAPSQPLDVEGLIQSDFGTSQSSVAVCHSGTAGAATNNDVNLIDCTGTPAADYAELYPTEEDVEYEELLVTTDTVVMTKNWQRISKLGKSSQPYQSTIIGISSNNYGDFSSIGYNIDEKDHPVPLALNGRVPVKATFENGPIAVGDPLTSSSTPGAVMKATQPGRVIGIALGPLSPATSHQPPATSIMVFVNPHWWHPDVALQRTEDGGQMTDGSLTVDRLIVREAATFEKNLVVKGDLTVEGTVVFKEKVVGSAFTRGTMTVPSGQSTATYTFPSPYHAAPVVVVTPTRDPQTRYWVEATAEGFKIKTSEPVTTDLPFTWVAQE